MLRTGVLLVIDAQVIARTANATSNDAPDATSDETSVATSIAWDALRAELYRFVARRVPASDADDIVQEALLRIHRGLPAVRAEGALVGWMYQVTRNAIADHLRASRNAAGSSGGGVADSAADEDVTSGAAVLGDPIPADDHAFESLVRCVTPFVGMLPPLYREAVELVELRGSTQVQAAAHLGIPLSTLKSRVQRGRAQLRELLEACCAIDLDARGHVVEVVPRCRCAVATAP